MHHIQRVRNKCANYIKRNNIDDMIGAKSEVVAEQAFAYIDVHLDIHNTMITPLYGLRKAEYLKKFGDIYTRL